MKIKIKVPIEIECEIFDDGKSQPQLSTIVNNNYHSNTFYLIKKSITIISKSNGTSNKEILGEVGNYFILLNE